MTDHAKHRPTTVGLKPCPFCGGEAKISWTQTSTPHPYARCKFGVRYTPMCAGATFFTYRYNTVQEAAIAWNRRAIDALMEDDRK